MSPPEESLGKTQDSTRPQEPRRAGAREPATLSSPAAQQRNSTGRGLVVLPSVCGGLGVRGTAGGSGAARGTPSQPWARPESRAPEEPDAGWARHHASPPRLTNHRSVMAAGHRTPESAALQGPQISIRTCARAEASGSEMLAGLGNYSLA